jgi:hypothetical protein
MAALVVDARADKRRDWALFFLSGGGMVMTMYAASVLWLVKGIPSYVFYMGLFAHIQILVVFTGILGLLVKRELKISKNEINISDHNEEDLIPRSEAVTAVEEAGTAVTEALDEIPAVTPTNGTNDQSR